MTKSKTRSMAFKAIPIIFMLVGILGIGLYHLYIRWPNKSSPAVEAPDPLFGWKYPAVKFPTTGSRGLLAYSSVRDPGGVSRGLPVRLKIPTIGVDSAIEDALITPDGRMDVPSGSVNVAWFALGPHPGQTGSAVIGGHFGIQNGVPFVFYKLDLLKAGDKVYVVDDKNETLAFVVRRIQLFDRNADSTPVFTSGDGVAHLNLITCEGVWNKVNDTYPSRRVVFTDSIPSEGAVTVAVKAAPTKVPPPKATVKPTDKPAPTLTPKPTAKLPDTAGAVEEKVASPSTVQQDAQGLFDNPVDGTISAVLLVSIVLFAIKIIRP